MKKMPQIGTTIVCLLCVSVILMGSGSGQVMFHPMNETVNHVMNDENATDEPHGHWHVNVQEIELNEEQQEELSRLYGEAFEKQKEIIDKYVEFGVLDEKHGQKITSRFDHYYAKLKENNFIPKWDAHENRHEQEQ